MVGHRFVSTPEKEANHPSSWHRFGGSSLLERRFEVWWHDQRGPVFVYRWCMRRRTDRYTSLLSQSRIVQSITTNPRQRINQREAVLCIPTTKDQAILHRHLVRQDGATMYDRLALHPRPLDEPATLLTSSTGRFCQCRPLGVVKTGLYQQTVAPCCRW